MDQEKKCSGGLGNTRPEPTTQSALRVLVDWVSVTFVMEADWNDVKAVLGLGDLDDFEYHDWGRDTFKEHIRFSNIVIQRKEENRYQLSLSGKGCREFETFSQYDWVELISILREFTYSKFTRLDIAIDDFRGHFDVARIRRYLESGLVVTRLEEYTDRKRGRINKKKDDELLEDSIYLGSQKGRLSINIYDKRLEREANDKVTDGSWDTWTRTELRLKKEYADQVADMILLYEDDLGHVALGILKKNIRFLKKNQKGTDKNKWRHKEANWWLDYIGKVDKLKFSLQAPDYTVEKSKEWFSKSVAPTLAMIYAAEKDEMEDWLIEMLQDGTSRLNRKHHTMISQARELNMKKAKQKIKKIDLDTRDNYNVINFKELKKSSLGQQGF